jgi:hypothetical protein
MTHATPYAQPVPKDGWKPPDEQVAARIQALAEAWEKVRELEAQIETLMGPIRDEATELTDKAGIGMPVLTLAEALKTQRKTVYRWIGKPMP